MSRSTPSLYISHKGESVLNFSTEALTRSIVYSTSSSVVNLPMANLIELWASSSFSPKALRTYEGSKLAEVQAEPDQ